MDWRNLLSTALAPDAAAPAGAAATSRRGEVAIYDTWDLSSLFLSDQAWEDALSAWERQIDRFAAFRGTLAESPKTLAACLEFDSEADRAGERLGTYAMLRAAEDQSDSHCQRMSSRFTQIASRMAQASSFIQPEILAVPAEKMEAFLRDPELAPHRLRLTRILRYKPHTLGREGREVAGDADRNGASGFAHFPPIERCRPEVRRDSGRDGPAGRVEPRDFHGDAPLPGPQRPLGGLPRLLCAIRRPPAHARRNA